MATTREAFSPTTTQVQDETLFQQLDNYPWNSDEEFQSGLQTILGSDPSQEQAEHLSLRARCFYFSRKHNISIDFNAYQTWRARLASASSSLPNGIYSTSGQTPWSRPNHSNTSSSPLVGQESQAMNSSRPAAPYPTSFSQIIELITNGHPIPGIKEVPDTILEGQASQPSTAKRKKPWEKDDTGSTDEAAVTTSAP